MVETTLDCLQSGDMSVEESRGLFTIVFPFRVENKYMLIPYENNDISLANLVIAPKLQMPTCVPLRKFFIDLVHHALKM